MITTSSLSPYFDDFINWKKQKGVDIELVTVEAICQNYSGDLISGIYDNAGKIRQFLFDAYSNGLEYALLGGTASVVPIRYGWGYDDASNAAYIIPSDLYFCDFDGNWDADGDSRYGEQTHDNVDYGAEIAVGRLLCTNGTEIQNWINKLLIYERNPGNGSTSYLKKAFYTQADHLQQYDQASDIATRFGSLFATNEIFEEEYNGIPNYNSPASPQFPTGNNVISEMNTGYGFVSWFNHGSPENIAVGAKGQNSCGGNDKKKVTNFDANTTTYCLYPESGNGLDNLTNSSKPFVVYTLACETTPFDTWKNIAPTDNLGAQISNKAGKGGPIYLGNTRYGYVTSSWYLQRSFTSILVGGTYQLGVAEANSKGTSGNHFVWLSHNLVGCPETEMWTDIPLNFTDAFAAKCGNNVIVNTGGVTNCTVCIMSSNDNGATYWHVDRSSSTEKMFTNVPSNFVITITKHNYIPLVVQSYEINTSLSSSIAGPETVCVSGTEFSIEEVPTGATIVWNKSSNISRYSGQGANPCTFSANGSELGWIKATVYDACGNMHNLQQKNVWVGKILPLSLSLTDCQTGLPKYTFCNGQANCVKAVNSDGNGYVDDWDWDVTGGYITYSSSSSNDSEVTIYPTNSSTFNVKVRAQNACGWTSWTDMGVTAIPCRGYYLVLSPNPSNGETIIAIEEGDSSEQSRTASSTLVIDENTFWDLEVCTSMQRLKTKQTKIKTKEIKLNTQGWKEGVYTVRARYKGEVLTAKLVVK